MLSIALFALLASAEIKTVGDAVEAIAAARDKDAALARVRAAGKPGLWTLCDAAKKRSGVERIRLLDAIGTFATPEAEWALLQELKKGDADTRAGVVRGLGHVKNPATYKYIIQAASAKEDLVRDAAADALAELGPRMNDKVQPLLASDDVRARSVAVAYIARAGNRMMVEQALPKALGDPAPEVQYRAIELALRAKDPVHATAIGRLARSKDEKVAMAAVEGLAELRGVNGAYELAAVIADDATLEPAWKRAAAIVRAFGTKGLSAYLDAVEKTSGSKRAYLADLFGESLDDAELAAIVDLVGDPSEKRGLAAREILDRAKDRGTSAAYTRLGKAHPSLRRALIVHLRERSGKEFATKLLERARSGAEAERLAAIELLGEVNDPGALSSLADLLTDPSPAVRARVASVVSQVADEKIAKALREIVKDQSPVVREGALKGLGRWIPRDREAVSAARNALADPEEPVRIAAIRALAKPTDAAVVTAFKRRLMEAGDSERAAIAEALGSSPLPEAVVILVKLATDPNDHVRKSAQAALTR